MAERQEARRFALSVAGFYGALFFAVGIHLPFLPVWLDARGLDAGAIALLLSCQIATRVVMGPLIAFVADRLGDRRLPLIVLTAGSTLAIASWNFAPGHAAIFAIGVVASMFWSPVFPMIDAFALAGARRLGSDYGRIRLWGSLSFIVASFVGGLALAAFSPLAIIWLLAPAHFCMFIAALLLPEDRMRRRNPARTGDRITLNEARKLAHAPVFLILVAAASLTQATHSIYYGFASLHWRELGLGGDMIGTLWALGVLAEIVLFALSSALLKRLAPATLILIGALAAMARWAVMSLDPPLWLLIPLQFTHALTFGATFLGTLHFISAAVPEKMQTTAQGLHAAIAAGLVMSGAMAASGPLYEAFSTGAYLVMTGLAAVAVLFALALRFKWDGRLIAIPSTR